MSSPRAGATAAKCFSGNAFPLDARTGTKKSFARPYQIPSAILGKCEPKTLSLPLRDGSHKLGFWIGHPMISASRGRGDFDPGGDVNIHFSESRAHKRIGGY